MSKSEIPVIPDVAFNLYLMEYSKKGSPVESKSYVSAQGLGLAEMRLKERYEDIDVESGKCIARGFTSEDDVGYETSFIGTD
ncbi:MAG: hypothetical protein HRT61_09895 [Ekhidna sp.]|nr:hypothetical protein [Ekhidna sp.]